MKRNINKISIFLAIIFILACMLYIEKSNPLKNSTDKKLELIVNEILIRDPTKNGYADIEWLTDEEKEELGNSNSKEELSKLYFVEGFYEKINSNTESANEYFEKALSILSNKSDYLLESRIYYEQSSILLAEDKEEESNAKFEKVKEVYENQNDKEYLVRLSILKGKELMNADVQAEDECIEILEDALVIAKEIDSEQMVDIYYYLGTAYWYDNQKIQAINYKLEALESATEKEDIQEMEYISIDLGIDFIEIGNYDDAIKYIKSVVDRAMERSGDDGYFIESYAWLNLYEAYSKGGYYKEAEEALKNAKFYVEKQEDGKKRIDDLAMLNFYKADLLTRLGNIEEAQMLLDQFEVEYNNTEIEFSYMDVDIMMENLQGDIYYESGRYAEALECHLKAKKIADERQLLSMRESNNHKIYMDYVGLGDYKNAFEYADINNQIKSEEKNDWDSQYSHYLISKFNHDKNEMRIDQLEQSQKLTRISSIFLGLIAVSSIIFTSIIYTKNKEIKRLNKIFKNLSNTDGLTGIPNRRCLDEYISASWTSILKNNMPVSFAMIDIDYFKKYNDNYGHPKGDEILKKVSSCIKSSCRKEDFVARYGGEEFIIIMLNANKKESIDIMSRILKNIGMMNIKHEYSEVSDRVTLSIGISTAQPGDSKNYDEYISMADSALYEAKKTRNTFVHND